MQQQTYSIYDSALEAYTHPFNSAGKGTAFRTFQDLVNNRETPFHKHPEHYSLFHLASFDDMTGLYKCLPAPVMVVTANEVLDKTPKLSAV
ncbi:MAG: nonstructural protein [Arizlama microvirus]|nr:MAG: nonstructural protein [Arizlama microvirus]